MLPFIEVLGKQIPMYSVMTLLGAVLGLLYFKLREKKMRFPEADAELALIYCFLGLLIGAKILYLITVWPEFVYDLRFVFSQTDAFLQKYLQGGFVFYGGMLGAVFSGWLYCRINKLDFFALCEVLMPVFALLHAFGRFGCFCMGCCYGTLSETLGIAYTHSPVAPNGIPLLPVQLFEAAFELTMSGILAIMARRGNSGRAMLSLWSVSYGVFRFGLEFFRGDSIRGSIGIFSTSQWISIFVVILGIVVWVRRKTKKVEETA